MVGTLAANDISIGRSEVCRCLGYANKRDVALLGASQRIQHLLSLPWKQLSKDSKRNMSDVTPILSGFKVAEGEVRPGGKNRNFTTGKAPILEGGDWPEWNST
jgi:hypothetical protein